MTAWQRNGYGLDWPGYNQDSLSVNIGGYNSYLVTGGFFITAKTDSGTVYGWDDFAVNSVASVGISGDANRYLVSRHRSRYKDGANWHLAQNPFDAEEVVETNWEFNGAWFQPTDNQNIPVSVSRVVRQWSGSEVDQDYIISEYILTNVNRRNDLEGVYLLFTYALSPNNRGWNLTYPNLTSGARNVESYWDPNERLLTFWAGDFKDSPGVDDSYDYFENQVYDPVEDNFDTEPEFIAHGHAGIKFLYISPDTFGVANRINGFTWSTAPPSGSSTAPFLGVTGLDAKYEAMEDVSKLSDAFSSADDPAMGRSRTLANFSLGPYTLQARGRDSVKIVIAQFVGGADYKTAIDPSSTKETIRAAGDSAVTYLSNRVSQTYANNYIVPMPPPGPEFSVNSLDEGGVIANVVTFGDTVETIPDPHQGVVDVAGYRIYRSFRLPIGPWEEIADISIGDEDFYDAASGTYRFIDNDVALGYSYYYAVTSYDNGHGSWAVDPTVEVPPLESSLFANKTSFPVRSTLRPTERSLEDIAVSPNPFYRNSGLPGLGDGNIIQFVNVPRKCTLRIFTVRGDLVRKIEHDNPESGVIAWNQVSQFGQLVKSGLYFYHIENEQGDVRKGKFAIVK